MYRKELPKLSQMISTKRTNTTSFRNNNTNTMLLDLSSFTRYITLFNLGARAGTVWQQPELIRQCVLMSSNMQWWNILTDMEVTFDPVSIQSDAGAM